MSTDSEQNELTTLVIGLGNLYRSDDALGIVVARLLKTRSPGHVTVIEQSGEGAALMEAWQDFSTVIIVDAMNSDAEPGTIYRFDASSEPLPGRIFHYSTHAFSLVEAIELARTLGELPQRLIVYGIQGKNFAAGQQLSAEVEHAIGVVIERLLTETAPVFN